MMRRIMQVAMCALGISVAVIGGSSAQTVPASSPPLLAPAESEWTKDVTVLAIAPDGTWGTATEPRFDRALAKAIANCKSKHHYQVGCGYRSASIRVGWIFAIRCGGENILVAAKTLQATEQAAVDAELGLRRDYKPDMPPCVRVVTVDPHGTIAAPEVVHLLRSVTGRNR